MFLTAGFFGALLVAALSLSGPGGQSVTPSSATTATPTPTPIADGYVLIPVLPEVNFDKMVNIALIPGLPDEAVAITQEGLLWRISLSSAFTPYLFGDLRDRVFFTPGEEGLLGIAFSPSFQTDDRVYIYFNRKKTGTPVCPWNGNLSLYTYDVLSRFQVSGSVLNPTSEESLIVLDDCRAWHNGGQLYFAPDGYLYLSIGDGGGTGDPDHHGQDKDVLFGKILRLDVSGASGYSSPAGNPFYGATPGRDEIWAYGFRNPWHFSFDSLNGNLWEGDVGEFNWEEVNKVVAGGNYGWSVMEGNDCFNLQDPNACDKTPYIPPREAYYQYNLPPCAIQGGFVYRGSVFSELSGWFTYGDYCSGEVWAVDTTGDANCLPAETGCHGIRLVDTPFAITGWAQRPNGELMVITHNNSLFRLALNDADDDDDAVLDGSDNCPIHANGPAQAAVPGVGNQTDTDGDGQGDACDSEDDDDSLGFTTTDSPLACQTGKLASPYFRDCIETFVGTDPLDSCAQTTTANDEAIDKVPADLNDDRRIGVTDRTLMVIAIKDQNQDPANYVQRYDLNAGGTVNISDRTILVLYIQNTDSLPCIP